MQKNVHLGVAVMAACSMELAAVTAHAQEAASDEKSQPKVESADEDGEARLRRRRSGWDWQFP